jgi:hypothetical protein
MFKETNEQYNKYFVCFRIYGSASARNRPRHRQTPRCGTAADSAKAGAAPTRGCVTHSPRAQCPSRSPLRGCGLGGPGGLRPGIVGPKSLALNSAQRFHREYSSHETEVLKAAMAKLLPGLRMRRSWRETPRRCGVGETPANVTVARTVRRLQQIHPQDQVCLSGFLGTAKSSARFLTLHPLAKKMSGPKTVPSEASALTNSVF